MISQVRKALQSYRTRPTTSQEDMAGEKNRWANQATSGHALAGSMVSDPARTTELSLFPENDPV
jgi:hypothetical protein